MYNVLKRRGSRLPGVGSSSAYNRLLCIQMAVGNLVSMNEQCMQSWSTV